MKEKISVIVPVYGVEKVLGRCVESILAQTYENIEIILVDDGSPDSCPAICDDYSRIFQYPDHTQKERRTYFRMERRSASCGRSAVGFCGQRRLDRSGHV